jgi:eukaryotic-like serine/threonine-protein kinase
VVAFNLLSGKQLFDGDTSAELASQAVNAIAPRVTAMAAQAIDPQLESLVADCLSQDPNQRPASAQSLLSRLDALVLSETWDQQKARLWWSANMDHSDTRASDDAQGLTDIETRRAFQSAAIG